MTQKTKWLDLLINGDTRKAEAAKVNDLYVVMVPAANLVDASGSGQNTPAVQGHRAVFDKNGVLLGVDALGWNAEGGFYNTKWPSKADSVYNANAAKTYAPQVFLQMKKDGGWMNKFQNGGSTQPTQDLAMKELMAIVQQAATELQSNKPGQGVQTLAQIANDPQGSQLLDVLVQQVPEAGQIVEAVMKMVGAFKCGGKAKKKVKKGAKGCVPCKKLMRVGGKLVNVLTDCEGNIISKHQAGGYLIPKGLVGLTAQFVQEPYRKAKAGTDAGNANDVHYYLGDDNKIYTQTYTAGTGWGAGKLADMNNFKNWATTANTSGKILGKNFFVNGFNFDYNTNMGTMSEADAQAAGIDGSKYATAGKVVDDVVGAGGNSLYGIEAKDPTKRDALNQRGLSSILNATFVKQNAANALAKENFRTQRRAVLRDKNLWGKGYLKNARNTKNAIIAENNAEASKDRAIWMTEFGHMNTPSNTTPVEIPKYQPATGTTPAAVTTTGYQSTSAKYKKQGGWLTKFQNGGLTDMPLAPYLKWITAKNDPRLQPEDNEAKYNAIGYGRDDLYGDNIHVGTKGEKTMFLIEDPSTPEVAKEFLLNNTLPGIRYRIHNRKFIDYPVFYSGRAPFPQALRLPTDPIKKEKAIKEILK